MASTRAQSVLPCRRLLGVRLTIRFTLTAMCSPRRYNPATLAAHGVNDCQLPVIDAAEGDDADFTVVPPVISPFQDRPVEDPDGVLEVDPMLGDVGRVLGGVPFERHLSIDTLY